jgi:hypothetical protein
MRGTGKDRNFAFPNPAKTVLVIEDTWILSHNLESAPPYLENQG